MFLFLSAARMTRFGLLLLRQAHAFGVFARTCQSHFYHDKTDKKKRIDCMRLTTTIEALFREPSQQAGFWLPGRSGR